VWGEDSLCQYAHNIANCEQSGEKLDMLLMTNFNFEFVLNFSLKSMSLLSMKLQVAGIVHAVLTIKCLRTERTAFLFNLLA
jgi:hypothetical protein